MQIFQFERGGHIVRQVSDSRNDYAEEECMLIIMSAGAHAASKKNKMNSPIKKSQTKRTECLMSDAEHDDLRTGIQSIMAQMDEMLSDLKKQPKKA